MRLRTLCSIGGAVALAAAVVACGDDADSNGSGEISVIDAWARTSPANVENGAAYMILTSDDGDRLTGAAVDASVAATVEIHETVTAGDSTGDTATGDTMTSDTMMDDTAAMTMRPVDGIDLPAGTDVALAPGGYHLMLLDLAEPLVSGATFELTLSFEEAGETTVEVEVRDDAP
jgi:hypothetical protein